ncbi:hypothetical protein GWK08_14170 [Leptobacterium flavescens]|uniref:Glycosyltransferase RgtA/B/C/D-like domain-containing protein n=1 Tax=Leptobacterium flavescens TaxID=472055 RepID=A0A6P0UNQ2_9FLAO|nr:glycosyltransferase family 39 protein [Leptobacterium flavescens]NER14597.1 hypothetical protein [Leptobacterium flavescens]
MSQKRKSVNLFYGFLILLTLVNLIQSFATELILDEAYYWYFSKNLDWGYFDHPPMVAFFVKAGTLLFGGELGVRFFASFLFTGTVYFLWRTIDDDLKYKNTALFCVLMASVALFNVYGFFMLPDTPLLFFAALFLWSYKQFLEKENIISILILAVSMAGMMYSKYHAVLLIGFIILSNLKILGKKNFWLAGILALLLYSPHLYWLYENDFNSLRYHLVERANSKYKINYTLDYVAGFFGVMGLAFPLIFKAFFKYEKKTAFDRGLSVVVYGIFVFFLISSFNRRTQAQWPLLVSLPLIIIAFNYALKHEKFKKWLFRFSLATLVLLSFLRIALVEERISPIVYESHGNKEWVAELHQKSEGRPVVFRNSYSEASMYSFYSGVEAMSANGYPFRKNQYDLDSSESNFRHKKVVYLSSQKGADSSFGYTRKFRNLKWKGIFVDDFRPWRKLKVTLQEEEIDPGSNSVSFKLDNPYNEEVAFGELKFYGLTLNRKKAVLDTLKVELENRFLNGRIPAKSSLEIRVDLKDTEKLQQAEFFRITIAENILSMGFQGNIVPVKE